MWGSALYITGADVHVPRWCIGHASSSAMLLVPDSRHIGSCCLPLWEILGPPLNIIFIRIETPPFMERNKLNIFPTWYLLTVTYCHILSTSCMKTFWVLRSYLEYLMSGTHWLIIYVVQSTTGNSSPSILKMLVRINRCDELRVYFNIGSQWSVSREIVRMKQHAELSWWWINWGAELRVHFNKGSQWGVSREIVWIKHRVELSRWQIIWGPKLTVHFNIGNQWSVSREIVWINHST